MASMGTLTVSGSFAEADAASLKKGQNATVTFPALSNATGSGTVTWISPVGSSSGSVVTYTALVTLENPPSSLRIGQSADIEVVTAEADNVLALPSNAVTILSDTEGTVQKVDGSVTAGSTPKTTTTTVQIGVQGDSMVQIKSGLSSGDTVLVSEDTSTGTTTTTTNNRSGLGSGSGFGGAGFGGEMPGGGFNRGGM
ncbi:MAG: HlyD family efflux transporter periplasmic adaptor subunit [Bifidobacteriaceae bacterium]|nr:HlyD family efflux transporter periplasmic adaptor subunit [Bifidobacteriaceae bacterium]